MNKIIGEDFHFLSFDPRWINGSVPQASCFVSKMQRATKEPSNDGDIKLGAGKMDTDVENRATVCYDIMGEHGAYINTPQTAVDMNSIIDAIG